MQVVAGGWGETLPLHHSKQPVVKAGSAQGDAVLHQRPWLAGEVWIEVGPLLDADRLSFMWMPWQAPFSTAKLN